MDRLQPQLGTQRDAVGRRIAAAIIDGLLLVVVGFAAIILATLVFDSALLGTFLAGIYGLAAFAYFVYMEGAYGQTVGKRVMDIVVVGEDGSKIDMRAAAIRNVLRIVDGFAAYQVGLVAMLTNDNRQRVGDMVAGTIVVRTAETTVPSETPSVMESRPVR